MDFQTPWVKYGVYYGITSIILQLISYYVFTIGQGTQALIGIALMITFFILAGKEQKHNNGDILPYGEALKTTFLTGFTGAVISVLFTIVMINLIDPSLLDKLIAIQLETTESMMKTFGMPEDQMAAALEKAEEEASTAFTPLKQLFGLAIASIVILIIAAITSIFIKKNEVLT